MFSRLASVLVLMSLCFAMPMAAMADAESDQAPKLIDQISPSIVTVRIVIKLTIKEGGQSRTRESRVVSEGVVVSPDGLVMMSSAPVSNDLIKQLIGGDDAKVDFSITPTDFKIVIGNEEKEYSAFLAATDIKTALAFIKITDLGDRKLTPIDLSQPAPVNMGDRVLAVSRLSKAYDYAPLYSSTRINGHINKPMPAWVLGGDIMSIGLPVYAVSGAPVGVMTLIAARASSEGDDDNSGSATDMMQHFEGSASSPLGYVMLPVSAVATVITEAEKQAATLTPPPAAAPSPASVAPSPTKSASPASGQ